MDLISKTEDLVGDRENLEMIIVPQQYLDMPFVCNFSLKIAVCLLVCEGACAVSVCSLMAVYLQCEFLGVATFE